MGVPKPAATVVAARPGSNGIEVLVLRRGPRSRFLPGYVVFPGGAVDAGDGELAAGWFGSEAHAAAACAVRELIEEAGLVLTAAGLGEAESGDDAMKEVWAAPPAGGALSEISRWIAPEDVPVRFDARFFALAAPEGIEPRPDGAEAERAWWVRPADLLEDFAAGRARLYWPTLKVLEALAGCGSVAEVLSLSVPQVEHGDGEPSGVGD